MPEDHMVHAWRGDLPRGTGHEPAGASDSRRHSEGQHGDHQEDRQGLFLA